MDITLLAQTAWILIAPFLGKVADKVTDKALEKVGEGAGEKIWQAVEPVLQKAPVEAVVHNPQDIAAQEALVGELRRVLAQDPALAAQVQQWVGGQGTIIATGGSAVAKDNGIAIGTVHGSVTFNR